MKKYNLIVVGGGIAGVAAAVSATREKLYARSLEHKAKVKICHVHICMHQMETVSF